MVERVESSRSGHRLGCQGSSGVRLAILDAKNRPRDSQIETPVFLSAPPEVSTRNRHLLQWRRRVAS
jgi:hypothetical protein